MFDWYELAELRINLLIFCVFFLPRYQNWGSINSRHSFCFIFLFVTCITSLCSSFYMFSINRPSSLATTPSHRVELYSISALEEQEPECCCHNEWILGSCELGQGLHPHGSICPRIEALYEGPSWRPARARSLWAQKERIGFGSPRISVPLLIPVCTDEPMCY